MVTDIEQSSMNPNMKVKIRDYRIIANMELEFYPGMNILQGPSNSGKSSAVSAVKSCIYNIPGTTNVRHGQNDYYVGISYRGHEVLYKKGKSGNTYIVDKQQYTKTGVNQLPVVAEALGMNDVMLGDEKLKINFWNQMSYPFLLDKTPGQLFKFIADSGEDEGLTSTQKSMVKDRQSTAVEYTLTEGKLQAEKDRIKLMESDIESAEEELKACEAIISLDSEITNLNNLININNKNKTLITNKNDKEIKLKSIKIDSGTEEQLIECEKEIKEINNFYSLASKYKTLSASKTSLQSRLASVPEIDTTAIDNELSQLQRELQLNSKYKQLLTSKTSKESRLPEISASIIDLESKLSEFKVCPLCGSNIERCDSHV